MEKNCEKKNFGRHFGKKNLKKKFEKKFWNIFLRTKKILIANIYNTINQCDIKNLEKNATKNVGNKFKNKIWKQIFLKKGEINFEKKLLRIFLRTKKILITKIYNTINQYVIKENNLEKNCKKKILEINFWEQKKYW